MTTGSAPLRSYPYRQPVTWWLRSRGALLYMVRELTGLPVAIWWLLFLLELSRLSNGAGGYRPLEGWFVVVSVMCLAAAVYHSYTFLNLAGLIMRIPLGDEKHVPARTIVGGAFSAFVVVTAIVAALIIWGGV